MTDEKSVIIPDFASLQMQTVLEMSKVFAVP